MKLLFTGLFTFLLSMNIFTQSTSDNKNVKIFYDCQTNCYETYIKQELKGVDFVRDPNFADVHLQITSETNASGGETYYVHFMGNKDFKEVNDEYHFATNDDMTSEQIRKRLLQYVKAGLVKFWIKKGKVDQLQVQLKVPKSAGKKQKDPWNLWVFRLSINGWFNGNSNNSNDQISSSVSAKQIKEKYKLYFRARHFYGKSQYKYQGNTITSERKSVGLSASEVFSIDQHWSYGFFQNYSRSLYSNLENSFQSFAGIEYNFYPYKENAKRNWILSARIGAVYNDYYEETIYEKNEELLGQLNLLMTNSYVLKWGNVYTKVGYKSYLHDYKLNSYEFGIGADIRLLKGLNFNIHGNYSVTHDQINIAAGNLSLEEILLRQKQLQSGYSYYAGVGLNYSFGSIYNTIVNPRFDEFF